VSHPASAIHRILRLAILSAFAKAPGFLIPIIIASFFGAGHETDAYFLAYSGVLLVGGTIGQPLEAVVVPFAAHALRLGRGASERFMFDLFRQGIMVGIVATVVGGLILAAGLALTRPVGLRISDVFAFYVLLAPTSVAWCVAGLYSGSLVSGWRLEVGAIGYVFRGIGALLGAAFGAWLHHLWPVAIGASLGECGRVWWLRVHWRSLLRSLDVGESGSPERGLLGAAASQMTAQGLISGAQLIERFIVSALAVAAVSYVEYANRLIMVAAILFDGGIAPWLLARWSHLQVRDSLPSNWDLVYKPILAGVAVAGAVGVFLALFASEIVEIVLQRGAFTVSDASVVATLLKWYAFGYVFNMGSLCVERLLLARAQNYSLARLSVLRALVRVGAVVIYVRQLGILALPVGYCVAEVVYLSTLLLFSRREVPSLSSMA